MMTKIGLLVLLTSLTACMYRMPSDDDWSTVPNTNNPNVYRGSGDVAMPGAGF